MRGLDEAPRIVELAVLGMHAAIAPDVVSVVASRRWIEGQQPNRGDAELGDIVELLDQEPGEIADAVIVGVEKGFQVKLIDDRVLVPERILDGR